MTNKSIGHRMSYDRPHSMFTSQDVRTIDKMANKGVTNHTTKIEYKMANKGVTNHTTNNEHSMFTSQDVRTIDKIANKGVTNNTTNNEHSMFTSQDVRTIDKTKIEYKMGCAHADYLDDDIIGNYYSANYYSDDDDDYDDDYDYEEYSFYTGVGRYQVRRIDKTKIEYKMGFAYLDYILRFKNISASCLKSSFNHDFEFHKFDALERLKIKFCFSPSIIRTNNGIKKLALNEEDIPVAYLLHFIFQNNTRVRLPNEILYLLKEFLF